MKKILKTVFWAGLIVTLAGTACSQVNRTMTQETRILPLRNGEIRAEAIVDGALDESGFWQPRCSSVGPIVFEEWISSEDGEGIGIALLKGKYCLKLEKLRVLKHIDGAWVPETLTDTLFITNYIPVTVGFGATDVDFNRN